MFEVKESILKALSLASGVEEEQINLEFSENLLFGDYTTNLCLRQKEPKEFADNLLEKLRANDKLMQVIEKVEAAGPGFINFWTKKEVLTKELKLINVKKEDYGDSVKLNGQKIMFEYGDANTHKLPHIGHLFSYIYGQSMTNILEKAGAFLYRVCYQGDVGLHVAKCLWAFEKEKPTVPEDLEGKVLLLQKMYSLGSKAFEENKEAKEEIMEINKKIYEEDKIVNKLWKETRDWNIKYYGDFEKLLNIKYDRHYYESEVYGKGIDIVKNNVDKVFEKSEGAIIFPGSRFGLHDRVFITKYDTPTYEAKDMYLQELKMSEWPSDLLVISTASEQNGYFSVVFKALETLDKKFKGKLKHVGFGMINLKSGKMSSRTGNIISAIDLIDKVKDEIKKINKDTDVAEKVALGAIKYSFLKNNPLQNMSFSIEESIAKEGNSGPYLQYTFARTQSVLRKAKSKAPDFSENQKLDEAESEIIRYLARFSEIIVNAAKSYSPNIVCNYLYNLAQKYNSFYNSSKIIGSESEDLRLCLNMAVGQVIKNGLSLLGIDAPVKM